MARKGWTEEEKHAAVALAGATSYREAANKYKVSKSTIHRWMQQINGTEQNGAGRNRVPKKIKEITREAAEGAKKEIADYIAEKSKQLAEEMIRDARTVKDILLCAIGEGKSANEYNSQWVRSLNGVMDYLVKNSNVLQGKGDGKDVNVNVQTGVYQFTGQGEPRQEVLSRIDRLVTSKPEGKGSPGGNGQLPD